MELIRTGIIFLILLFVYTTTSFAQSDEFSGIIKKHLNETVQEVKTAENAGDKRKLLNESFDKILSAIDEVESRLSLDETETRQLAVLKNDFLEKSNQLNGREGYAMIRDENLNDFSDYTQQDMEQADTILTISVSTAILIILLLLLL